MKLLEEYKINQELKISLKEQTKKSKDSNKVQNSKNKHLYKKIKKDSSFQLKSMKLR